MRIHAKLVGFVSGALVIPLLLGVFYIRYFGKLYYQKQQGMVQRMIAEELAGTLQDGIHQKFQQGLTWVALSMLSPLAAAVPLTPFSMEEVQQIESKWSGPAKTEGVLRTILSNPLSGFMGAFQRLNPEYVEILMTDRYGRLIGATNPATDYWQADEAWWKTASELPSGGGIIKGLQYDESAGVLAIEMVFPVYSFKNSDDFLGVLKVSLHATRLLQGAAPRSLNKAIARDIIFPDGQLFAHINSGKPPVFSKIPGEILQKLLAAPDGWGAVELHPGTLSLAAAVSVQITNGSSAPVEGLKDTGEMYVVVSRDLNEAMMPVWDVLRKLTIWGIVTALIFASSSYLLITHWFVRPIKKLRNASLSLVGCIKLSEQGQFEDSWESRQKARQHLDELESIRGHDELQGLSRDFMQMGERMVSFLRQIEEKLGK